MSAGLPYLQKLRKSDLTEFAETTHLQNYSGLRKAELETALDDHLRTNSTTYARESTLAGYYKRLGSTGTSTSTSTSAIRSPIKKIAEKVSDIVKSDEDTPPAAKKGRTPKKTTKPEEESSDTDGAMRTLVKTPAKEVVRRTSAMASQIPLPPSPAMVADVVDQQTKRLRNSVSHAYDRTQIHEYSDYFREMLSSSATINILAILLEAYGLRAELLPNKRLTEIPPIPYLKASRTPIDVPDLFQLLNTSFWAPFTLWLLITVAVPALVSYFINLPLKQLPSHNYATRRASIKASPRMQFDPFVFNLAKGLVSYLVLGKHLSLGLYGKDAVYAVEKAVFGAPGLLTSSGIGAAVSLYEAVLKK